MRGPRMGVEAASQSHTAASGRAAAPGTYMPVFFSRMVRNTKSIWGAGGGRHGGGCQRACRAEAEAG